MNKFYVEQINILLQNFHFNNECAPAARETHFSTLHGGLNGLYNAAFFSGDIETVSELKPLMLQVLDGEIPKPINLELCA